MSRKRAETPGERLTAAVVDGFDLEEHELLLLRQAAATADLVEELASVVAREGVIVRSPQGEKVHPALVEVRQQRIALARLLAALRVPLAEEEDGSARPQRRVGVRGVYGLGSVS